MPEKIKKDEKSNLLSVRKLKELLHSRYRKLRHVEAPPNNSLQACYFFTGNCKPLSLARLYFYGSRLARRWNSVTTERHRCLGNHR